jgi:hypothetical protein
MCCDNRNVRNMSIAQHVIEKCGGPAAVAAMTGVHVSRVHRWTYPKARGGTGGLIPAQHQQVILAEAKRLGIALQPSDFFEPVGVPAMSNHAEAAA